MEECGLWEERYYYGVCCATKNFFYFLETNGDRKFWISLTSIQDIQCIKGTYFDDLTFYKHDGTQVCIFRIVFLFY